MKKLTEKQIEKDMQATNKILDGLRTSALSLTKLRRKYKLDENRFYKTVKTILSRDEYKKLMQQRKGGPIISQRKIRQQRFDMNHKQLIDEFQQQEKAKTKQKYECCGCGQTYEAEPVICIKCNGLHFQTVNLPVKAAISGSISIGAACTGTEG